MPIAPFIPLLASGISGGIGLWNDAQNRRAQQDANAQSQQYNYRMYLLQQKDQKQQYDQSRQDALWDYQYQRQNALSDYNMQNEYNSPQAMMGRLKMAGLNPNLAYGQQPQAAAPVRSTDQKSAEYKSTPYQSYQPGVERYREDFSGVPGALAQYFDIKLKQAQTDNVKAMNTVAIQEALLKAAQTAKTTTEGAQSKFDLDLANQLRTLTVDRAQQEVKKIGADITLKHGQATLTKQQLINIQTDNRLKLIDEKLREKGLTPSDPTYLRVMAQAMDDPKKTWQNMKAYINNLFK